MTAASVREISRFLLVGALNTALTYAIYLVLLMWMSYLTAYSISYAAGILISYLLNTGFVFRVQRNLRQAALFPLVYVATYVFGLAILDVAVRHLGITKPFALAASLVATVPTSFLLLRFLLKSASHESSLSNKGMH